MVTFPAMAWSRLLVMALAGALMAAPAWGQEDDDLAPLTPKKKPDGAKPKPKPRPARPPVVVKPRPAPTPDEDLAPLTPLMGDLVLKLAATSTTRRAKVTIDDKDVGTLPVPPQTLSPGEHTVVVRAPGFAWWTRKVTLVGNKPSEVTVTLEATAALVSVTSDSSGAEVLINGKGVGTAPVEEMEVAPGSTTIVVRKDGFAESTQTVKLVAGREYPISVKLGTVPVTPAIVAGSDRPENTNLTPANPDASLGLEASVEPTPAYKRWYVWAGAAAVVAAVAVGVGVGVNNSKPKRLTEAEICGPKGCDACIGCAGIVRF